jgi:peptidyl-prolyl cis-trans isomerase C
MANFQNKLIILVFFLLSITGCGGNNASSPNPGNLPTADANLPTVSPNPPTPAPTPTQVIILVGSVNQEGIQEYGFNASLSQIERAQTEVGDLLKDGEDPKIIVFDALVDRLLLAQGARKNGYELTSEIVDQRMVILTEKTGGAEALSAWIDNNGYTFDQFIQEIQLEIEAAWQRDFIAEGIPESVPQVRARQVLFQDAYLATRAYNQLLAGASFDTIVANNDPFNQGYLDWIPRGYLIFPDLDTIVFSLQPGEFSDVIETEIGFLIIEVMDFDENRLLSADARFTLQSQAVQNWLATQRQESQIEINIP